MEMVQLHLDFATYAGSNYDVDELYVQISRRFIIMANGTIAFDTLTTSDSS